jgi:adenylosuccinate lyase
MIPRYTPPEMGRLWTDQHKYETWLQVEIAACNAHAKLGNVPKDSAERVAAKATFDIDRIDELEKELNHDVIAFLTSVADSIGDDSRHVHLGMTSSDMLDTALAMVLVEAGALIRERLVKLRDIIAEQARKHKDTLMMGRSHGVFAEPITFGLKMGMWHEEVKRGITRLDHAIESVRVGQVSGAVGTYAFIDPQVEQLVCAELNLQPASVSTQILQRDRHAEYMTVLALIGASLEKFANEVRLLQRTDVGEVTEPFGKGQKGSSAMPHKKNPITCERVSGLARILRTNALAAIENVALWHERDITHSSVERVILPDSTILLYYMLGLFNRVMEGLQVHADRMQSNIELSKGTIYSQSVLLALTGHGMRREDAYRVVQKHAHTLAETGKDFRTSVREDEAVRELLTDAELDACFDPKNFVRHVDTILQRTGIL